MKEAHQESTFPDPTGKFKSAPSSSQVEALLRENKVLRDDLDAAIAAALKLKDELGLSRQ